MVVALALRRARRIDLDALATLWHTVWDESHRPLVPAALLPHRDRDSFRKRLSRKLDHCVVCDMPCGDIAGFAMVGDSELEQLFVGSAARGPAAGLSLGLLRAAEAELAFRGAATAHLFALANNARAVRFYEKSGWSRGDARVNHVEIENGTFPLDCYRFERRLPPAAEIRGERILAGT